MWSVEEPKKGQRNAKHHKASLFNLLPTKTVSWSNIEGLYRIQFITGKPRVMHPTLRVVCERFDEMLFVVVGGPLPDGNDGLDETVSSNTS